MRRAAASVPLLCCVLICCRSASGQAVYGAIWGNVSDNSGRAIAGAAVTAKSISKQTVEKTVTNSAGGYVIGHLIPDDYYDVRVSATDFTDAVTPSILVYANQDINVNFKLQTQSPGSRGETSGEQSVLSPYRADVFTTFRPLDLANLPVANRVFSNLQLFVPGGVKTLVFGDPHENLQIGVPIQLNSLLISGTRYEQDGTEIPKNTQGSLVFNPPLEGLSQMQVSTENLDPEFGQATSVVILQTKSGSNNWHGSLFEYYGNLVGAAGPADVQFPGATTPKQNLFGGSIGGPLVRNKLFIFGNYEGNREATRETTAVPVPTALLRSTCLNPASAYCDLSDYGVNIYDPVTHSPFKPMGNCVTTVSVDGCIPTTSLSQPAINLLKLFPAPNVPGTPAAFLYQTSGGSVVGHDHADTRVDYVSSSKLKAFGRYSFGDDRLNAPPVLGGNLGGSGFVQGVDNPVAFSGQSRVRTHTLATGFDYDVSPNVIADLRFGFTRYHSKTLPYGYGTSPAAAAGIPNVNFGDLFTSLLPDFDIGGFGRAIDSPIRFGYSQFGNGCNCPLLSAEQQFQVVNNWTKITGRHIVKWGADLRYLEGMRLSNTIPNVATPIVSAGSMASYLVPDFNILKTLFDGLPPAGHFAFSASNTALINPNTKMQTGGLGLATFLLGNVTGFQRSLNNASPEERQRQWSFYGQDTFRVTRKLTLTYGLRWEIYFPQTLTGKGQGAWLDLGTGLFNVAGYANTNLHGNVRNSYTNFGPILGIAYSIHNNSVLRAGYRRSFDPGLGALIFGDNVTHNPPALEFQQCGASRNASVTVFTLSQGPPLSTASANCGSVKLPVISPTGQVPLQPGLGTSVLPYPPQPANLVPSRVRVPTVDAWNVSFQHALTQNLGFTLAYVGNKGTHVFFDSGPTYDLNQPVLNNEFMAGAVIAAHRYPLCQLAWAVANCNTYDKTPSLSYTQNINYFGANSSSHYESLQASVQQRFSKSMSLLASYTWSSAADFSSIYFDQDPRLGYAAADFDRKNKFTMTNVVALPFGRGQRLLGNASGIAGWIVNGWSLSATTIWASGLPFSPTYYSAECVQDRDTGPCQPNLIGAVHITGSRNGWFTASPQLFSKCGSSCPGPWQRPAAATFGDAGRNSIRGPGFFQSDLSLAKRFTLTERLALQFRWDVYNAFNKVNLGEPNSCVDCGSQSGQIVQTAIDAEQRQMQFALRLEF